jgi:hypothetical protein
MGLIFAGGVFSGLPGASAVALAGAAADFSVHRKPVRKAAFNAATMLLSGAAFTGVLRAVDSSPDPSEWARLLGPVLLGGVAAFAVNSGLVSVAIGLETGRNPAGVWSSNFRWLAPHFVLLAAAGLFAAAACDRWETAGLTALVALMALTWLAMKLHADRAGMTGGAARGAS